MTIKKEVFTFVILIIYLVIFSSSVFALGIGPAKTSIAFEPNLKVNKTFYIINLKHEEGVVKPSVSGDLADYVTKVSEVNVTKDVYKIPFQIEFKFPDFLYAGTHLGYVKIVSTDKSSGTMSAVTAVKAKVELEVPPSGKHLSADDLSTRKTTQKTVDFTIGLHNDGTEDIEEVKGFITLTLNNKATLIPTDSISLQSQDEGKIKAMNQNVSPGLYNVDVEISYDGSVLVFSDNVAIGKESPHFELNIPKQKEKKVVEDPKSYTTVFLLTILLVVILISVIQIIRHKHIVIESKNKHKTHKTRKTRK